MVAIPTITQLYNSILADIETQYSISIPIIGKSFLRGLAAVQAAKLWLIYLLLANIQKNIWFDTADSESNGGTLERFGRIIIGRNPFPAQAAQYSVMVTGTVGATIGTLTNPQTFVSDQTSLNPNMIFILDTPHTLVSTIDYITIRALTPGTASALNTLDTLTSTSPIANVSSSVVVQPNPVVDPLDAETIDTYRQAIINQERLSPQIGSATSYIIWSQDASGVAAVYPYASTNVSNSIDLFIEAIASDSTDGKGTPTANIISSVESVVNFNPDTTLPILQRGRRPMTVNVNYLPVTPLNIDIVITGYTTVTTTIQQLIQQVLSTYVSAIRPFVAAAGDPSSENDTIDIYDIISQIKTNIPQSLFTGITLNVNNSPVTSYQFIFGYIPYLNSITYA